MSGTACSLCIGTRRIFRVSLSRFIPALYFGASTNNEDDHAEDAYGCTDPKHDLPLIDRILQRENAIDVLRAVIHKAPNK